MAEEFTPGAEIEVAHPFVREEYHGFDEDGPFKRMTWRPGTRVEPVYPDDAEEVADALGTQIITIVSVHKPGRFPARVFFTRRWRDPDGHEFGKTKCHIKTAQSLRRRCRAFGYRFRLADPTLPPAHPHPAENTGGFHRTSQIAEAIIGQDTPEDDAP